MNFTSVFENISNYENLTNITRQIKPYFCTNIDYFNILLLNAIFLTIIHKEIPELLGKKFKQQGKIAKEICNSKTYISAIQTIDIIYILIIIFVANGWL